MRRRPIDRNATFDRDYGSRASSSVRARAIAYSRLELPSQFMQAHRKRMKEWMPSTIGFRVFLPFFSSCQPMPSSRPFLVQPWFQLLMPSTSPHLKSFFKGLGGPKRSGSLEKDQNHILGKQSRQSWGFPYPLQIPSENALRRCPKKTHHHCAQDSSTL